MQIAKSIAQAQALFDVLPRPLGFVPTMGALHDGHLELVRCARAECFAVAVSVFVNPLQFAPNEDLARYPRDFDGDCVRLSDVGVDVLFAPPPQAMYPSDFSTSVDVGEIGAAYEGATRPTHFRGVATVVAKLLNIVQPDSLYLGQKDAQQTTVVRKMVRDLGFRARVIMVPTVRESDGLAMSTRNRYLSPPERAAAPSLHGALVAMHDALVGGSSKTQAQARGRDAIGESAQLEYLDIVDADTFAPLDRLRARSFLIGAARFGTTRLLDNLWIVD